MRWRSTGPFRVRNPAPFSHFIRLPGTAIASTSPERFLSIGSQGGRELTDCRVLGSSTVSPMSTTATFLGRPGVWGTLVLFGAGAAIPSAAAQRSRVPDRPPPEDRRLPARCRGVALALRGTRRPGRRRDGQGQHRAFSARPCSRSPPRAGDPGYERKILLLPADGLVSLPRPVAPSVLRADLGPGAGNPSARSSLGCWAYCGRPQCLLSKGVEA